MAVRNATEKPAVQIEADGLAALQRDLKKIGDGSLKQFRVGLKQGGEIVASDARNRIGVVSQRIAGSVKVSATNKGVAVKAGGSKAPHAPAFENLGREGDFRHPVFGNRNVWVPQVAHPFLMPAAQGKADDVLAAVLAAFDSLLSEAGFH